MFESDEVASAERIFTLCAVLQRGFGKNTKTYGFSLGRCDVPGQKKQEERGGAERDG